MIFAGDILLKLINGTNIFNELKKKNVFHTNDRRYSGFYFWRTNHVRMLKFGLLVPFDIPNWYEYLYPIFITTSNLSLMHVFQWLCGPFM
jgi:hypothetical protein